MTRDTARHHEKPRDVRLPGSEGGALGDANPAAGVQVALSTASVLPERAPDAFETAARLGYDGIEVMVAMDPISQDLYPLRARGAELTAYAPHWNPVELDCPHATLDLSHTAVSGSDALAMADELGSRLAHVHMADGTAAG